MLHICSKEHICNIYAITQHYLFTLSLFLQTTNICHRDLKYYFKTRYYQISFLFGIIILNMAQCMQS